MELGECVDTYGYGMSRAFRGHSTHHSYEARETKKVRKKYCSINYRQGILAILNYTEQTQ